MRSGNFTSRFDIEAGRDDESIFEEELVRKSFVRKVFFILTVQLLVTLGIVAAFVFNQNVQDYVAENPHLVMVAFGFLFFTMIVLACCPDVRRKEPINYICLGLFTLAESFMLGVITSMYDPMTILTALGLTAAVCFTLTLFAMQTKCDFTVMGGFLLIVTLVLLVFGIVMLFFHSHLMRTIYCSLGVIVFSLYLLFDTQLMLGGNHQYALSPDEYVFAALNLYIDIVQIFLFILTLVGDQE